MASTNGSFAQPESIMPAQTEPTVGGPNNGDLSKDEVGWYFVEQYYTTLSRSPEKLHLFYSKRSQFVYGPEAELATVSVGRSAIQDRIKELGFHDCKVRVSNVDSQGSFDNIVIQVIGEISNKNADLKKFCQTFVLAQQPSGYFVLNDIFRTISEDAEDDVDVAADEAEPEPEPTPQESEPVLAAEEPVAVSAVDAKLEEVVAEETPATNGHDEAKDETAEDDVVAEEETTPSVTEQSVDEVKAEEKAAEPLPAPAKDSKSVPAPAPVPAAPAKPMSWASRAAAGAAAAVGTPRPALPISKPATAAKAAAATPAPAAASKPVAPAAAAASPAAASAVPATGDVEKSAGWQTAGENTKRQNRPQSISGPPADKEGTLGYVRHVTDNVKSEELRAALASYGELIYFDVNRSKNCAFVEFASTAGYLAAAAANPHHIGGEAIIVEPRRPKAAGFAGSYPNRGGANARGRGNFPPNRGRGSVRGRGASQVANA